MDNLFELILLGIIGLFLLYLFLRTGSFAIFKSWFEAKHQNEERRKNDGN